jgi:hypothetical protein
LGLYSYILLFGLFEIFPKCRLGDILVVLGSGFAKGDLVEDNRGVYTE